MKVTIVGRKYEVSDELRAKIEKKLSKLDKFFESDATANVTLSQERGRHILEVTVTNKGMLYRAQEATGNPLASLDGAVDALERQIRRNKMWLKSRLREGAFDSFNIDSEPVVEETEFEVVKTKKFPLKPMSVEEAILQMNMLDHTFFVFTNAETHTVNVVYKRNDGKYGLLTPDYKD